VPRRFSYGDYQGQSKQASVLADTDTGW